MNQLNSLVLEGNVTKLVEAHENGMSDFEIGVTREFQNTRGDKVKETSYFTIRVFGTMAKICEKNVKLNRGVRIVGRLKQETWTDSDGKKRSLVVVIAEHVEFKPLKVKD